MSNWKNRPMMMKSGGSVNKETLIDLAKRLQEERVNFGPIYSNKKSRGARFDVRDGILDLIQDKESGKKSLKYSRGPASLEAYTDDPYAGSGVKGNITLRFSKGGPVQGFVQGGRVGTSKVRPSGNIIEEEIVKFDELNRPIFVRPSSKRNRPDNFSNMKLIEDLIATLPTKRTQARGSASGKMVPNFASLGILGLQDNVLGGESKDLARYFQANPERYDAVMERFDGNLSDLTEYLKSDEVTAEDAELFGSTNLVEIQKNIAKSREGEGEPTEISTESGQGDGQSDQETETPPEQQAKEKTDLQLFADEIAIRDQGSYSPEAQRAGQVASMYGQISPGQVGGFGVAEARGAAAAEATQQKIEADEREIGGALAKKRMELAAAPKYGALTDFRLGKLGEQDLVLQKYVSKTPGSRESLPAEGSAATVVNEVYRGLKSAQDGIAKINWLKKNSDGATGTPATVKRFLEQASALFGSGLPAGQQTSQKAVVEFLRLQYARDLLGEGGKTISDNERRMVAEALGEPGAFTTLAELQIKLQQVEDKLKGTVAEHDRFIRNAAAEHPSIDEALKDYQINVLGRQENSQKPLVLNKETGMYE